MSAVSQLDASEIAEGNQTRGSPALHGCSIARRSSLLFAEPHKWSRLTRRKSRHRTWFRVIPKIIEAAGRERRWTFETLHGQSRCPKAPMVGSPHYSAGSEWCSCITRHRPSIFRRPMVNRNSSSSRSPFESMSTHRPVAVAKATSWPAVISTS